MSDTPLRIVVDTNVWIDSYCPEHIGSPAARHVLAAATAHGAQLFYPVHAAKDIAFVIRHEHLRAARRECGEIDEATARAIRELSWACLRAINEIATAVGADGSDLWLADKYLRIHPDLEDNLVIAACHRIKANYLVTSNQQLIAHADVTAKTPEQMLELLALDW